MFGQRLVHAQLADGDLPGEFLVDGAVRLAGLPRAVLDPLEFAGGGRHVPGLYCLALHAGDVDRGEHVAHSPRPSPEIRRRPGLVDQFHGDVRQGVDYPGPDESRAVADPNHWIDGVLDLAADFRGRLGRWHLERGDDRVAGEDGDARAFAGVDTDHGAPLVPAEDGDDLLDGPSRIVGGRTDDVNALGRPLLVLGRDEDRRAFGEVVAGFYRRELDAAVA